MIGRITGKLLEKRPPTIIVDVNGIGYEVDVPMSSFFTLPATGQAVTLHTHLIVREDAHLLYGFATEEERYVFRQLLKISGIGARTALSVLSGLSVSELFQAVSTQDGARLTRIPGIGKKTAERLLLELRDKLDTGTTATRPEAGGGGRTDALHALVSLGYNEKEAAAVLGRIAGEPSLQETIRQALKLLSKA